MNHGFSSRTAAGIELGAAVLKLKLRRPILVLGLPRGGVPVAFEVARALDAPLDVLVVRKVGMPGQPELALGAIASGGILVQEPHVASHFGGSAMDFKRLAERERIELERREHAYRGGLPRSICGAVPWSWSTMVSRLARRCSPRYVLHARLEPPRLSSQRR